MTEERFWFCVFSPATLKDFEDMPSKNIGFRNSVPRGRIERIRPGHKFFAYVTQVSKIVGMFEVLKPYDPVDKGVWFDKTITYSIAVKPLIKFSIDEAPTFHDISHTQSWFKQLKKKNSWSFAFRIPPRELKYEDGVALKDLLLTWNQNQN